MKRRRNGLILGLAILFSPAFAHAQPEGTLKVDGQIAETDKADPVRKRPAKVHEIKLLKGKSYQIDLTSKVLDTFLRLEDSTGKQVADDDDGGGDLNSQIVYTPEKDDTFKIYVTSVGIIKKTPVGPYTLTVTPVAPPKVISLAAPTADKATQHEGQLLANDPKDPVKKQAAKIHVVDLKGGKTYTIDLQSKFDNFLRLEDAKGKQLADDDDGGGDFNARIVFACPADGQYRIIATSFFGGNGPYVLKVAQQP